MPSRTSRAVVAAHDGLPTGADRAAPPLFDAWSGDALAPRGHLDLLHENGGLVPWCGPAALALATGRSLDDASTLLRDSSPEWYPPNGPVVTAYWRDLLAALDRCGVAHAPLASLPAATARPSLLALLRRGGAEGGCLEPGWFLMRVTGHFLLLRSHGFGLGAVHDNRHSGLLVTHHTGGGQRRVTHAARLLGGPLILQPA